MCDSSALEESFRTLLSKEIQALSDHFTLLPPLPSRLRYLIHESLQTHPVLQTVSVGIEPHRQTIIFKSTSPFIQFEEVVPDQTFNSLLEEFNFKTHQSITNLATPVHNFNIFTSTLDHMPEEKLDQCKYVLISSGIPYIEIRRTLKNYYRKGWANCYEVDTTGSEDTAKLEHIVILNSPETAEEVYVSHHRELSLHRVQTHKGPSVHLIHVMLECGTLKPALPRAGLDKKAAVNMMNRHLGREMKR